MARNPNTTAPKSVRKFMKEIGTKGGAIGGKRRAAKMTPEELSAHGKLMAERKRIRAEIRAFEGTEEPGN